MMICAPSPASSPFKCNEHLVNYRYPVCVEHYTQREGRGLSAGITSRILPLIPVRIPWLRHISKALLILVDGPLFHPYPFPYSFKSLLSRCVSPDDINRKALIGLSYFIPPPHSGINPPFPFPYPSTRNVYPEPDHPISGDSSMDHSELSRLKT